MKTIKAPSDELLSNLSLKNFYVFIGHCTISCEKRLSSSRIYY